MNLGAHECDDGNTIDGDGCDSKCRIEPGYKCHKQENGADVCKSASYLYATLTVQKGNKLKIKFSERSLSLVNSTVKARTFRQRVERINSSDYERGRS